MDDFRVSLKEVLVEMAVSIPAFWVAYIIGLPPMGAFVVGVAAMSLMRTFNGGNFQGMTGDVDRNLPIISLANALFFLNCVALAQWAQYLKGQDFMGCLHVVVSFASLAAIILAGKYAWLMTQTKTTLRRKQPEKDAGKQGN